MPHAELKYSADLALDVPVVLRDIEAIIARHDSGAGACKGRGYAASDYHHTHLLVTLNLLTKPHRDAAFSQALMADIEAGVKAHLTQSCHVSLALHYSDAYYITNFHEVPA
ncbi:MAG: hypothetical protein N4A61_16020 [Pelagimonas sp.]|jgi:hypothetical protein|nr:hypothetical protein [Pelagimonas sp.]